ncbi:MAG TPA: DUF2283 domain-containing protein [Candidatus Dormibacteraeota bacterium]
MQVLVTYDSEADAGYVALVRIAPGDAVRQQAVRVADRGELVLDFDTDGRLLGIEVLGATAIMRPEVIAAALPSGQGLDNW